MHERRSLDTTKLAKILSDAGDLLAAIRHYYLFGRYSPKFPETPYFLFSQCARVLHEFEVTRKGSDMSTEPGDDHFIRFLREILLYRLNVLRCASQPVALPADTEMFRNQSAYCHFWFDALKTTGRLTGVNVDGLCQALLDCVGAQGVLNDPPEKSMRKAVGQLFQTAEAGKVLIQSEWILEDVSAAIVSWLAKCQVEKCIKDILRATACVLKWERHCILSSAIPVGPYRVRRDDCWGRPRGLIGYRLCDTQGRLTLIKRETTGQIACVFEWEKDARLRQKSWLIDVGKSQRSYEEMLFTTWEYGTGLLGNGEGQMQETPASWQLEPLEANHLDHVSQKTSELVDAVDRHPSYSPLASAIRDKLREGKERWEPCYVRWTYIKEMDTLIRAIDSARLGSWPKEMYQKKTMTSACQHGVTPREPGAVSLTRGRAQVAAKNQKDSEARAKKNVSGFVLERRSSSRRSFGSQISQNDSTWEDATVPLPETAMDGGEREGETAGGLQQQSTKRSSSVEELQYGGPSEEDTSRDQKAQMPREMQTKIPKDESRQGDNPQETLGQETQDRPSSYTDTGGPERARKSGRRTRTQESRSPRTNAITEKPTAKSKTQAKAGPERVRKSGRRTRTQESRSPRTNATSEKPTAKSKTQAKAGPERARKSGRRTRAQEFQSPQTNATSEKPTASSKTQAKARSGRAQKSEKGTQAQEP